MPAYDENPTSAAVLKRTRDHFATIQRAFAALKSPTTSNVRERARQASRNLEMLVDRKEMRQVHALTEHAGEFDQKLAQLRGECERLVVGISLAPDDRQRLDLAIKRFVESPVASGSFMSTRAAQEPRPTTARSTPPAAKPASPPIPRTDSLVVSSPAFVENSFSLLLADEARCKAAETCPRLHVRSRFHEPNSRTLPTWQSVEGFYRDGIDRRVAFVCESPSKTRDPITPDFIVEGVDGYRCWSGYNARNTDPFTAFRREHGLEHSFITNVVKCGMKGGKPDEDDTRRCSNFLWRELSLIQPAIIACVGALTSQLVEESMQHWPAPLASNPAIVYVTHYSAASRGMRPEELLRRWSEEVAGIKAELRRRGLPDDQPVFIPVQ